MVGRRERRTAGSRHEDTPAVDPPVSRPGGVAGLVLRLQASGGNRAVTRLLDSAARDGLADGIQARSGTGEPLAAPVRAQVEQRLGAGFGDVRIHRDVAAATLAAGLGARAFTAGQDVFFGAGGYAPETPAGFATLVHELVHTTQATPASQRGVTVSDPGDPDERMAEQVAAHVTAGGTAALRHGTGEGAHIRRSIAQLDEAAQRTIPDTTAEDAARMVAELAAAPVSLAQYGPRRCVVHLMQEVAAGGQPVTRAELDRRSQRYARLVIVRPDGYWADALTGEALQRAFPAERAMSPPYEIGRFFYSDAGTMYATDAALLRTGPPVAELGLEHDWFNSALDGAEDAAAAMMRGIGRLITDPVRTIAGLARLPGALRQLIADSPEYWERFQVMPLPDQIRAVSELCTTLLLMYGTAAGSTSVIGGAAGEIGDVTVSVLRLQANGAFAVAEVTVPVGTVATAMSGGPGAVYVMAMMSGAGGQGGSQGGGSGGSGGGSGGNPPQFIAAVRELDGAEEAARLTDVQRAALEWNAQAIAGTTGVPLASGRIAWRSLLSQLRRPRWRFLDQAPEAATTLRDMLRGLPDGPYAPGDPTRAELMTQLASWPGGTP